LVGDNRRLMFANFWQMDAGRDIANTLNVAALSSEPMEIFGT